MLVVVVRVVAADVVGTVLQRVFALVVGRARGGHFAQAVVVERAQTLRRIPVDGRGDVLRDGFGLTALVAADRLDVAEEL